MREIDLLAKVDGQLNDIVEAVLKDSTVTIETFEDDIPVRGNAVASGDAKLDKKIEDEILDRLSKGDIWAWARVSITMKHKATGLYAVEHLGACSYEDEEGFKTGGYFEDMKQTAAQEIANKLVRAWAYVDSVISQEVLNDG